MGRVITAEDFAAICRELARRGAANINIVTGSHAVPALAAGIQAARESGVTLPMLWNTSAYETDTALTLLCGGRPSRRLVDIWLPDVKTLDPALAARCFAAPDYPHAAENAVRFMLDNAPLEWAAKPFASALRRGVIIRHLILPGEIESTRQTLRWFAENARGRALLSLMTQYTPPPEPYQDTRLPPRHINAREYAAALKMLDEFGIDDGFVQEPVHDTAWLPDFAKINPFGAALSLPVWHWETGFVIRS
jgi:putative pyruvate formate lyase activating enzyme